MEKQPTQKVNKVKERQKAECVAVSLGSHLLASLVTSRVLSILLSIVLTNLQTSNHCSRFLELVCVDSTEWLLTLNQVAQLSAYSSNKILL